MVEPQNRMFNFIYAGNFIRGINIELNINHGGF